MQKYMGAEERNPVSIPFCLIGGKTADFKGNQSYLKYSRTAGPIYLL